MSLPTFTELNTLGWSYWGGIGVTGAPNSGITLYDCGFSWWGGIFVSNEYGAAPSGPVIPVLLHHLRQQEICG